MSAHRFVARVVTIAMVVGTLFGSTLQSAHAERGKNVVPAVKKTKNLIKNPGDEAGKLKADGTVTLPHWTISSYNPTGVRYGTPGGFPDAGTPGPPNRGKNFFAGGLNPNPGHGVLFGAQVAQVISIAKYKTAIDAGLVSFTIQGWLGGFAADADDAGVYVIFETASHEPIGSTEQIGPVTHTDRSDQTEFLSRTLTDAVPGTARFVQVTIVLAGQDGAYMDGYADNLSLVLTGV